MRGTKRKQLQDQPARQSELNFITQNGAQLKYIWFRARFRQSVKTEEAELDKEISDLLSHTASSSALSSEVPYDSIMDPDSEEEDEVHDLLAEE